MYFWQASLKSQLFIVFDHKLIENDICSAIINLKDNAR